MLNHCAGSLALKCKGRARIKQVKIYKSMNTLLYKSGGLRASPSLLALSDWQEKEKQALNCAVDEEGCLLDNLTLELRVHPPEVHIDNAGTSQSTLVTIDSANRPGSLVFVSS